METISAIVSWCVFGLVVGVIARFVMPGRQAMSLLMTIALGVAGSFAGGLIASLVRGGVSTEFHASGLIWSILGALILLFGYSWLQKSKPNL